MMQQIKWRISLAGSRYTDENWLKNQYVTQEIEIEDIAKSCGVDKTVIIRWLDEYRIYRNWRRLNQLTIPIVFCTMVT